ncbi:MAG: GNAT family N-acetyltransferase [Planctomycetes bacterium]|nr:GNAT family N-acetyltransferase [Planctomycetota bacterium]
MSTPAAVAAPGTLVTPPAVLVRRVRGADARAWADRVGAWLGLDGVGTLADTFPQVYHDEARAEVLAACAAGEVVAQVAWRRVLLHTAAGPARAFLIGSVATAPAWRGRGLASRLLREVVAIAQAERGDLCLLWSGQHAFYARLGFVPAGRLYEVELRPGSAAPEVPGLRAARPADLAAIRELHRARPLRVERSLADLALACTAAPMQIVCLERAGTVAAYACLGKGADFPGWWHEVGGTDRDVHALLLGATAALGLACAGVLVPPYRPDLLAALRAQGAPVHPAPGALRLALSERGASEFFVDGLDSV